MKRFALLAFVVACSSKSAPPPPTSGSGSAAGAAVAEMKTDPTSVVGMADRTEHDKKLDPGRKPAEMLKFIDVKPGMHVADLGAGSGYTTELLARSVGPTGKVIAQDSPSWDGPDLKKLWVDRLARPGLANTTHVMQAWETPLPADAKDLDAVVFNCAYHDVIGEKADVKKLDAAVFAALKPHGTFIVIDNTTKDGAGVTEVEHLHRIEEKTVRADLEAAGFKFVSDASFLRNSDDTRDWNADPDADKRTHTQDRFVLKFEKP